MLDITPDPTVCPACVEVAPTVPPAERERMLDAYSHAAARDPNVQVLAATLYVGLGDTLGRVPNACEVLQCLMDAVHDLVSYLPDPAGREIFQPVQSILGNAMGSETSPLTGFMRGGDDCEGLASVFVAFALCLGFRARNVWVDQEGATLNHVRAEVCNNGQFPTNFARMCIVIESTVPGAFPGETTDAALARVGDHFHSRVYGESATN